MRANRHRLLQHVLLCAALVLCAPAPAVGGSMGPLDEHVAIGPFEPWWGEIDSGVYWIENRVDTGDIAYFFSPWNGGDDPRSAAVTLRFGAGLNEGLAGLLYGFDADARTYSLLLLDASGGIEVHRRGADGFERLARERVDIDPLAPVRLSLEERGGRLSLRVDGTEVLDLERASLGRGALGVAAAGIGRFGFADYTESTTAPDASISASSGTPAASLANASPEATSDRNGAPGGALVMEEKLVRDEGRGGLPALRLLVPRGWSFEGSVKAPPPALYEQPYLLDLRVEAPSGKYVQFYPFLVFGYSDLVSVRPLHPYEGRLFMPPPDSLGEMTRRISELAPQRTIGDVRILSEETLDRATEWARRESAARYRAAEAFTRQGSSIGQRMDYDIVAKRLDFRYRRDGREFEETQFARLSSSVVRLPNGAIKAAQWVVADAYGVGAPTGTADYLADPELAAVVRSLRVEPDWAYALDLWYAGRRQEIVREGAARAAAAARSWTNDRGEATKDALDISFDSWKRRESLSDSGQSLVVDSIHERTNYASATGEVMALPSFYDQAYTDGRGNYVLHNDANWNLGTDPSFNDRDWTRLREIR